MRAPELRLQFDDDELVVDNFAGGGGASTGIAEVLGRDPDYAINHDAEALAIFQANHPQTQVLCEDVFDVEPRKLVNGRRVGLGWFSPDCTYFSKARGAKPHRDPDRARRRRGLAGVVIKWAAQVRPRILCVENVEEFQHWGPLDKSTGKPDPARRGQSFRRWVSRLRNLGYVVEWRQLRACDYGAPTSRRRLFIVARCDGAPIVWPEPTHGPGRAPYRTAAECIDWTIPCPSIFERAKPLKPATLRRIARGVMKFVIRSKEPFLVPLTHRGERAPHGVREPFRTITGANRGESAVCVPALVQMGHGERDGQAPRTLEIQAPLGTVTAGGNHHALVTAFLAKHFGGPRQTAGASLEAPIGVVTAADHHSLIASSLVKLKGTCRDGQPVTVPLGTVQAQGLHYAEVRAFLLAYYGTDQDGDLKSPLPTVTTRDRFAIVTISGIDYAIVDIGMRMLTPRELYNAQGFPAHYRIDPMYRGKVLSKTAQVHKCGNSVSPYQSAALVRAQLGLGGSSWGRSGQLDLFGGG